MFYFITGCLRSEAQSFITLLSPTAVSYGDLNISALPTLGAQKQSRLSLSLCPQPTHQGPVEFSSSVHLWKFPHEMLFIRSCRAQARAHARGFPGWVVRAAKTGALPWPLQSGCGSQGKACCGRLIGASMPQGRRRRPGVALTSGTSANGSSAN